VTVTLYVPRDMMAVALGADRVAALLREGAASLGTEVRIVRTGSRGLQWLEPLVEVMTPTGRVAYGPVRPADVAGLLAAGLLEGRPHALWLGGRRTCRIWRGSSA
jgi:formate dehydrogenase iron-sulfur subunit